MAEVAAQETDAWIRKGFSLSFLLYAVTCPISQSANYVPLACICLIALYSRLKNKVSFYCPSPVRTLTILWLSAIIWQSFTLLINGAGFSLSPLTRSMSTLPVILLSGIRIDAERRRAIAERAALTLLAVSGIIILLGLIQSATGLSYPFPRQLFHDGKLFGFFGYYIHAGGFFSTLAVFALCLVLFWHTSIKKKAILFILFSILVAGTLISFSRTYYVSLFVTLPLIFLRKDRKAVILGISILLSLVIALYVFSPAMRDRAVSITDLKANSSNVERLYLWRTARDVISDNPFSGIGFRQWGKRATPYLGTYSSEWQFTPASLHHAHNTYLTVAAETGVPGLILFLGFWLYLLYLMLRKTGKITGDTFAAAINLGASYALINLFIGGMFEDNFGKVLNISLIAFLISLSMFVGQNENTETSAIE